MLSPCLSQWVVCIMILKWFLHFPMVCSIKLTKQMCTQQTRRHIPMANHVCLWYFHQFNSSFRSLMISISPVTALSSATVKLLNTLYWYQETVMTSGQNSYSTILNSCKHCLPPNNIRKHSTTPPQTVITVKYLKNKHDTLSLLSSIFVRYRRLIKVLKNIMKNL